MNRRAVGVVVTSGVVLAAMVGLAPSAFAGFVGQTPTGAIVNGQGLPMPLSGNCADLKGSAAEAAVSGGTGLTGGWVSSWEPWGGQPILGILMTPMHVTEPVAQWGYGCIRTIANFEGSWYIVGTGPGQGPIPPEYYDDAQS